MWVLRVCYRMIVSVEGEKKWVVRKGCVCANERREECK